MKKLYTFLLMSFISVSNVEAVSFQSPIGSGYWKITYPYNYKTHKCYGSFFDPNSSKGNPACDTYSLDFMPLHCSDKYGRFGKETVHAAAAGTVVIAKYQGIYGNTVLINHGNGIYSRYAHLKSIESRVVKGKKLRAGSLLGKTGNSSTSNIGKHLHFSVYKKLNGKAKAYKPEPLGGMTGFDSGKYSGVNIFVDGKYIKSGEKCKL